MPVVPGVCLLPNNINVNAETMQKVKILLLLFFPFCLPGQNDYSLSFDGDDDNVDVPFHTSQNFGTDPATFECWFRKPPVSSEHASQTPLITNYKTVVTAVLGIYIGGFTEDYSGKLNFFYRTTTNAEFNLKSTIRVDDNVWHHVAAVKDLNAIHIYIDGALNASMAVSNGNCDSQQGFTMGGGHLDRFMIVKMDEVRVWKKALSASEVAHYKDNCPASNDPDLVAHWQFDEGTGITALDETANNNDGTLIGGVSWITEVPYAECANLVLPVELVSFDVVKRQDNIHLTWETAREWNSDHFQIEWSTDAKNFSPIEKIKAAGNSFSPETYEYLHTFPANGTNYYRLKEVSTDGRYQFSNIKSVNFAVQESLVRIYPTLSGGTVYIENLPRGTDYDRQIMVSDPNGNPVWFKTIPYDQTTIQLDLHNLPKGIYFLHIRSARYTGYRKIILN
jgi:hypothetical protein